MDNVVLRERIDVVDERADERYDDQERDGADPECRPPVFPKGSPAGHAESLIRGSTAMAARSATMLPTTTRAAKITVVAMTTG